MKRLINEETWRRLWAEDSAQDLLEYALLAALMVIVAVATLSQVGSTVLTQFWEVIGAVDGNV